MILSIDKIKNVANNIAPKYAIKKIILFGSYAEQTANEKSDIDFIIEYNKNAVSLFLISSLKNELEEALGKQVDVIHGPLVPDSIIQVNKVVSLYG